MKVAPAHAASMRPSDPCRSRTCSEHAPERSMSLHACSGLPFEPFLALVVQHEAATSGGPHVAAGDGEYRDEVRAGPAFHGAKALAVPAQQEPVFAGGPRVRGAEAGDAVQRL